MQSLLRASFVSRIYNTVVDLVIECGALRHRADRVPKRDAVLVVERGEGGNNTERRAALDLLEGSHHPRDTAHA